MPLSRRSCGPQRGERPSPSDHLPEHRVEHLLVVVGRDVRPLVGELVEPGEDCVAALNELEPDRCVQ
jgi:hypothetical protein